MVFKDEEPKRNRLPRDRDFGNTNRHPLPFKCSLCGKTYDRTESKSVPFCSVRCQQIDLGNWLNEDYGFPVESGEVADDSTDDG